MVYKSVALFSLSVSFIFMMDNHLLYVIYNIFTFPEKWNDKTQMTKMFTNVGNNAIPQNTQHAQQQNGIKQNGALSKQVAGRMESFSVAYLLHTKSPKIQSTCIIVTAGLNMLPERS
jgi:hypothetical protein